MSRSDPYCVIGDDVRIGDRTRLHGHLVLEGPDHHRRRQRVLSHSPRSARGARISNTPVNRPGRKSETATRFASSSLCTAAPRQRVPNRHRIGQQLPRLCPRGARLGRGKPLHTLERCHPGRTRDRGRSRHPLRDWRASTSFAGSVNAQHGRSGCTKIVQDVPPFTIADGHPAQLRGPESRRPPAPRVFRSRDPFARSKRRTRLFF